MLVKLQSAIALFTCGCLVSVAASPSSIGFVVTSGQVEVDGAVVHGNATLFQGNVVQAGNATSDLMFPGGSNLLLQPGVSSQGLPRVCRSCSEEGPSSGVPTHWSRMG